MTLGRCPLCISCSRGTTCQPTLSLSQVVKRWSSNPSGKCSYARPTRGTVCGTMRSMYGADAGCLAVNHRSLSITGRKRCGRVGGWKRQGGAASTEFTPEEFQNFRVSGQTLSCIISCENSTNASNSCPNASPYLPLTSLHSIL